MIAGGSPHDSRKKNAPHAHRPLTQPRERTFFFSFRRRHLASNPDPVKIRKLVPLSYITRFAQENTTKKKTTRKKTKQPATTRKCEPLLIAASRTHTHTQRERELRSSVCGGVWSRLELANFFFLSA